MKCTLDNVVMWLIPIYAFPRLNIKSFGSKIIIYLREQQTSLRLSMII